MLPIKEKIESIDKMIAEWERQRSFSARKFEEVKEGRTEEYTRLWMGYLSDKFPFENTHIRMSSERLEVYRDVEDSNRRELMTIYFREKWGVEEFTELNTSVYSSSENSQWELERLITVGAVANVLLDHYDDILAELNTVKSEWSERWSSAYKDIRNADLEINNLHNYKNKIYLDHAENLLMGEGLSFDKANRLGSFRINQDWNVSSIINAKVTEVSKSGKTCTIEVEQYFSYYDQTEKRTYHKVRMRNVEDLLWQYRDYFLKAEVENQAA